MVGLPWGSRALRVVVFGILTIKKRWIHPAPPLSDAIFWSTSIAGGETLQFLRFGRQGPTKNLDLNHPGFWMDDGSQGEKCVFNNCDFIDGNYAAWKKKLDGKMIK